jgi:hypothetical protein
VFFPPMLACNLSLTLCCVCPYCAVSVIGLVAVDLLTYLLMELSAS